MTHVHSASIPLIGRGVLTWIVPYGLPNTSFADTVQCGLASIGPFGGILLLTS